MPEVRLEPLAANYSLLNGYPCLYVDAQVGQLSNFSVDLSRRFIHTESNRCTINQYRIGKVMRGNTVVPPVEVKRVFQISNTGVLSIT